MPLAAKVAGTHKELAPSGRVAGTWRTFSEAWVKVAGVWKQAFVAFSATVSPSAGSGGRFGFGEGTAYTNEVFTATPVGGVAPYSYLWEQTGGDPMFAAPNNAQSTQIGKTASPVNDYYSTWRCRITDSVGNIAYTPEIAAHLLFDTGL